MQRYVYFFGRGEAEGGSEIKHLVGGKGASLGDMTRARLQVPAGFTISAECCALYFQNQRQWPDGLEEEIERNLERLENLVDRTFGRGHQPLLVAVRSGAAVSMPGMMDTILNVGLNPDCVRAMAAHTDKPRAPWEAYLHFLLTFVRTIGGLDEEILAHLVSDYLREVGRSSEDQLGAADFEILCDRLRALYHGRLGEDLPTEPWLMLCAAVNAVFCSWNSERAVAYRRHHRIEGLLGTAVNVQMMCPAEVSGVMFTANPVNPALGQIIIESSYGLGESVVLGKVTPDRFVVERKSGEIVERIISFKGHITASLSHDSLGHARDAASLPDHRVLDLARLGEAVEKYFQVPCDIEWALSGGEFYLLQTRPIRLGGGLERGAPGAVDEAALLRSASPRSKAASSTAFHNPEEVERVRQEEIEALTARAQAGGTVWSRYNLAEVLPEPTPMTWSIVRRFMSGRGGFGLMYRDLGFDPDPALDEEGIFDLVCGRPYCNLSREPRMQYRRLPFEHPFSVLKAHPHRALYPQAIFNPARASWRFWLFLPVIFFKEWWASARQRSISRSFPQKFHGEILPAFLQEVENEAARDWAILSPQGLLERLQFWIHRTLNDFARDSLKPTALAGLALGNLERALSPRLQSENPEGPENSGLPRVQAILRQLIMGVRPDPEADLALALRDLSEGRLSQEKFIHGFGHRARQEMELSLPRWEEDPATVASLVQEEAVGLVLEKKSPHETGTSPASWEQIWDTIASEAKLSPGQRAALEEELRRLQTYLGLRETAKHHLLRGYALIRRILVELDRRFQLEGGIFYLNLEELPALIENQADFREKLMPLIESRKKRREIALSLFVPQVLFSDALEVIGNQPQPVVEAGGNIWQGAPLSAGVAEGPAWVLQQPTQDQMPAEPYILVCPSTDPAWVPLFLHARGLVMETGGMLSHGAIVAREFGLPAVAGLPDIQRQIQTGQRLRIDGSTGKVTILA